MIIKFQFNTLSTKDTKSTKNQNPKREILVSGVAENPNATPSVARDFINFIFRAFRVFRGQALQHNSFNSCFRVTAKINQ